MKTTSTLRVVLRLSGSPTQSIPNRIETTSTIAATSVWTGDWWRTATAAAAIAISAVTQKPLPLETLPLAPSMSDNSISDRNSSASPQSAVAVCQRSSGLPASAIEKAIR